jgi:hypothetical protein
MDIESAALTVELEKYIRVAHFGHSESVVRALAGRVGGGTSITVMKMGAPALPEAVLHAGHHAVWQYPWSMACDLLVDYLPQAFVIEVTEISDVSILGRLCRYGIPVLVLRPPMLEFIVEKRLAESLELFTDVRCVTPNVLWLT